MVIGLADRQSLGAAVDGRAFDLEALNAHRGQFRELPVDDGKESLGTVEAGANRVASRVTSAARTWRTSCMGEYIGGKTLGRHEMATKEYAVPLGIF